MNNEEGLSLLVDSMDPMLEIESGIGALAIGVDEIMSATASEPGSWGDLGTLAAELRVRAVQASEISRRLSERAAALDVLSEVVQELPPPPLPPPSPKRAKAKARAKVLSRKAK